MGAALAMAEDTTGIGSGGGADKATIAAPEALESRACGGAGEQGLKGHRMARPQIELMHRWERASERSLGQKECDLARGIDKIGPTDRGKGCDRVKGTHLWRPQSRGYIVT